MNDLIFINEMEPLPKGYKFLGYILKEGKFGQMVCIKDGLDFVEAKPLSNDGTEYYYRIKQ